MALFDCNYSLDEVIDYAIISARKNGMSYDDILAVLYEKSVLCECMSKAEKSGLSEQILKVVESVMEGKQ